MLSDNAVTDGACLARNSLFTLVLKTFSLNIVTKHRNLLYLGKKKHTICVTSVPVRQLSKLLN